MLTYKNLDQTSAYEKLRKAPPFDVTGLTAERVERCQIPLAAGLTFSWAASPLDEATLDILAELAREQELPEKYRALAEGERMNTGENRLVLHHLLRGQLGADVILEGRNQRDFYREQQDRFTAFAGSVREGALKGSTGKPFTTVVQVGIGGSDLGPRALYLALAEWVRTHRAASEPLLEARFISNVDPDDAAAVLADIDFESTLFVLVSKSGTTQETLTNEQFVAELAAQRSPGLEIGKHIVAVTSETSPMARNEGYLESFFIDDYIGGRYSATSAVGGVVLSIAFGPRIFQRLLDGAHQADRAALEPEIRKNAALLDALLGLYERNVLAMAATAVLPYSQALSRFPAHLQQLDMESNGKSVNRRGEPLGYQTGPLVFGEPGTNGQHSFYQLLHQGTTPVPLQFIGFRDSQQGRDTTFEGSTSQTKLKANLAAQIVAFARGRAHENPNKHFPGGRPSTLIVGDQLTPEALGALLAHYENKVMFQGFAWNLNSFDQEGVQLGKVLTTELLTGAPGPELQAFARLLGVSAG
ncbi:glucose-6-phosphate isomerase [Alkalispirochaeta sphaeroplastigenens]|uniref:Glucose-6-phosphate isomerase n=1 Tax=Alkalispirochaeta sphaeroplastigenens TaxID=1187066 RepID=A0A2S4JHS3_9SPIO|nr:glucose-6-phosphate isomerase [Alkalispirochaeta sphaeroplastigenens]POQ99108.1 glucose-6-phosphate isomerase [Alkalispirochaeta sphaeroplastigenens]